MFYISITVVTLFVFWGVIGSSNFNKVTTAGLNWVITNLSWFYVMTTTVFVIFSLYLAFSSNGRVKLGSPDSRPDYSLFSWIGMLFAAGMGVGLVFWAVAEPVSHYVDPPPGVEPQTNAAAQAALKYSVFHWAIQPWAIYAVVGLTLAYFKFRKNKPGLISHAFYPLLGDRVNGPIGKLINIIAVVATTIGIATTFGLSALQVSGGISEIFGVPNNKTAQLIIIAVVGGTFMLSVLAGVDKGIRKLSNANLILAGLLLLSVLVLGPTVLLLENFFTTLGTYISNYTYLSLDLNPYDDSNWQGKWTVFYWAWLIAWAPFVGTFIARISRGRTIQEFILGALAVPALLGALWFVVFGGTAIHFQATGVVDVSAPAQNNPEVALFLTLQQLPFGTVLSVMALGLVTIFFITSAASATYVLGVLSSGGTLKPKTSTEIIWGTLISGMAASLLLSGGLKALQAASIITALPFAAILLIMCVSLKIALRREQSKER